MFPLLSRAMLILQIKRELHRPIGRGEGDDEGGQDDDRELPPYFGKQFEVIEDQDGPGHEEDAHVVDEELPHFVDVVGFDPSNEQEDEEQ